MLPVSPYKALKYPPSNLFPRFGNAGSLPPQYRRASSEHQQAMLARRQASQKLLADRAPPQAEVPGEQYFDAEEEPQVEAIDPDMPPLEEVNGDEPDEVPAEMPGGGPRPDDDPEREPVEAPYDRGRRARQIQNAGQWAGFGGMGVVRGMGAVA